MLLRTVRKSTIHATTFIFENNLGPKRKSRITEEILVYGTMQSQVETTSAIVIRAQDPRVGKASNCSETPRISYKCKRGTGVVLLLSGSCRSPLLIRERR